MAGYPNRTITGKFKPIQLMMVGQNYIFTPHGISKIGPDNLYWQAIAYGNGRYVVVGNQGAVTSSTDGVTWTEPKVLGSSNHVWDDLIFINGQFVAVGAAKQGGAGYIVASNDGINWTTIKTVGTSGWSAITYGNGKYVVTGFGCNITTSPNGIDWTTPIQYGYNVWYRDVAYGNGRFVAITSSGYIANSADGITWTTENVRQGSKWSCISYGNGKFIVLDGYGSNTAISTTGMTWITQKNLVGTFPNDITYIDGTYVTVGSSGKISMSKDGINWPAPEIIKDNSGNEMQVQLECVRSAPE